MRRGVTSLGAKTTLDGDSRETPSPNFPPLELLCQEVFALVEKDQGKGFVPESVASQHRDHEHFFDRIRAMEAHSRRASNNLRRFLKKYDRY